MSSNIRIEKRCVFCGKVYTAKTFTTKYCSHNCSQHAYKQRIRDKKIFLAKKDTLFQTNSHQATILMQGEYLSVIQTAQMIGVSRYTAYRYLAEGILNSKKIWGKTFITKQEVVDLFKDKTPLFLDNKPTQITDFYTMDEIREKYNYQKGWIYKMIAQKNIPKTLHRGRALYSKKHIDKLFQSKMDEHGISQWYKSGDIKNIYGMSFTPIYSFVYEKNIPKRKVGNQTYYSKEHFDAAKGVLHYCTYAEAMEKYNLTRDALYGCVARHKIPKVKEGRYVKISKLHLDQIFKQLIITKNQ